MRYVLVATPAYLRQHASPSTPEELSTHRCIYLGYAAFGDRWTMQRGKQQCHVQVPTRLTINNSSAILAAVLANGGIGLVPDFTAQAAIAAGQIQVILPDWDFCEPYTGNIYAVYTPGKHLALKIRALIDYLLD